MTDFQSCYLIYRKLQNGGFGAVRRKTNGKHPPEVEMLRNTGSMHFNSMGMAEFWQSWQINCFCTRLSIIRPNIDSDIVKSLKFEYWCHLDMLKFDKFHVETASALLRQVTMSSERLLTLGIWLPLIWCSFAGPSVPWYHVLVVFYRLYLYTVV